MIHFTQQSTHSAHFLDHLNGILYLENGNTVNVGQSQSHHEVFASIDRIKERFMQSGIMGPDDIITSAL